MSKMREAYRLYRSREGKASEEIFITRITLWVWLYETPACERNSEEIIRLSKMIDNLGGVYLKDPRRYDEFEISITQTLNR